MTHTNTAGASPIFEAGKRCVLPNGLNIAYQSKSEVAHFYHDIFEKKVYLQSGISLNNGGCVFDVGANIGLFSLFVSCYYRDTRVYAFEPAPPLFAILQANVEEHARNVRLFNFGLSNRNETAALTFYPNSSGMSSFYADLDQEKHALATILEAEMRSGKAGVADLMVYREEFLDERFKMESYQCSLRRLSDTIREQEVDHIDLLKIDVQKSEMDVLEGIDEEHWKKIEQVVLEVHDFEDRLARVDGLLRNKSYRTRIAQDDLYHGSPIFNIYAVKDHASVNRMAGANNHEILEEAPAASPSGSGRPFQLVMLSARSHTALSRKTDHLLEWMKRNQRQSLSDVAYTLNVGRSDFKHRKFLVCNGADDAVSAIQAQHSKRVLEGCYEGKRPRIVFMFPGLGNEYPDMGLGLYRSESVFREALDRCCEILHSEMRLPILNVLYPGLNDADSTAGPSETRAVINDSAIDLRQMLRQPQTEGASSELSKTCYSQPAIFAVEFALAQLWMSWGIRPDALIGYSVGEYVAACLSGVLTLEQAVVLVARRAELIDALPLSGLLAVPLSEEALSPLLNSGAAIAAVNGPAMCVVAGTAESLEALAGVLAQRAVVCRPPQVQHAFHSSFMQPVAGALTELFKTVDLRPPRIPYVSNLTGNWIKNSQATDPSYWAMHTCERIRFRDGVDLLKDEGYSAMLEVGPGQALGAWVLQNTSGAGESQLMALPSLPHSYDHTPDVAMMLGSLGKLWLAGVEPDWASFYGSERRHRVALPKYPFEGQQYSIDRFQTTVADRNASSSRIAEQKRTQKDQSQSDVPGPRHARTNTRVEYVAPRTSLERKLAELWLSILSADEVGVYDNFFELGGDSILATQLTLRVKESFGADVTLRTIFESPTVSDLVVAIVQRQAECSDHDEVARELAEISRLSPEELQAMLAAESDSED